MSSYKTLKELILTELEENLEDIAEHGAACGYPLISYYTDTQELYKQYDEEIWEALNQDAEDQGCTSTFSLISSFGGSKDVTSREAFENLLVWYYVERVAHEYVNAKEEEENA